MDGTVARGKMADVHCAHTVSGESRFCAQCVCVRVRPCASVCVRGSGDAHGANAKNIAEHQRHAGKNAAQAGSSREQSGEKGGSAHGEGGKRKEAACTGISGEHEGGIHSTPVQRCEHTETPNGTEARPSRKRAVRSYTEAPRRQEEKPRWRGYMERTMRTTRGADVRAIVTGKRTRQRAEESAAAHREAGRPAKRTQQSPHGPPRFDPGGAG